MKRLLFTIVVLLLAMSAPPASAAASQSDERVLAQGAALHGANGMVFDRHDRLHIASVAGREIVVMDPETGAILDRLGPDQGVEGPDDLTFGPDGALYWTSFFTGVVGRRAPDGTVSTVAQLPPGAGAITFSDDGRLFVALSALGDALYEVDPGGANPPRLIAKDLGGLNAMDWGSDGLLYGPLNFRGQVVRINVDTGAIAPVADDFGLPAAAKFDSQGRLYVVDQLHGEVVSSMPTSSHGARPPRCTRQDHRPYCWGSTCELWRPVNGIGADLTVSLAWSAAVASSRGYGWGGHLPQPQRRPTAGSWRRG
jgi:sugar lactone lactonase YvrE